MLPPKRPSGSLPSPAARVGTGATQVMPVYEIVKARVLVRLHDRLDPAKSRRMPLSLLQQTARQQVEQVIDAEAPRMSRADRDRLAEEVLGEAFGFGPLEELLRDPTVKEVMVLGPHAVVVRRDPGWTPTNVKFRDEDHVRIILEKALTQGEPVAGVPAQTVIDAKLAGHGVYDLARLEIGELRRVVAAYVQEFCATENVYLSDTDQGRLTLEILAGMNR